MASQLWRISRDAITNPVAAQEERGFRVARASQKSQRNQAATIGTTTRETSSGVREDR
jgi:hypothetical protein